MRRRFCASVACAWLCLNVAAAKETVVLFGDDAYPPYAYVEGNEYRGIYVDLLRKAAQRMPDYLIELQPVPWKRGLMSLEQGKIFALFPPYVRKERSYIESYSTRLGTESVVVFCRKDALTKPRLHWPADFSDLKLGINAGFALSDKLVSARKAGQVQVIEAKGNEANVLALTSRSIDCYINDRASVLWTINRLRHRVGVRDAINSLDIESVATLSNEPAHIAYTANDGGRFSFRQDFVLKFDRVLQQLILDGEFDRITARYVGQASADN